MDVELQFQQDRQVCVQGPVWSYVPVKRCFHPEDPFFEEGALHCNILRQKLDNSEEFEDLVFDRSDFQCDVPGCGEWFSNVPSYEAHYNSLHRHSCQKCKRSFPSTHLLEIHVLENHDTLFRMIANTRNLYRCLVESCPDRFSSDEERKEHLVSHHKYPADFRFNRPTRKQQKSKTVQFTEEAMDTSCLPKKAASEVSTVQRKILPKTICFGRGSTKAFQKDFTKQDKNKKKSKKKMENSMQHTCQEITMSETSYQRQICKHHSEMLDTEIWNKSSSSDCKILRC